MQACAREQKGKGAAMGPHQEAHKHCGEVQCKDKMGKYMEQFKMEAERPAHKVIAEVNRHHIRANTAAGAAVASANRAVERILHPPAPATAFMQPPGFWS